MPRGKDILDYKQAVEAWEAAKAAVKRKNRSWLSRIIGDDWEGVVVVACGVGGIPACLLAWGGHDWRVAAISLAPICTGLFTIMQWILAERTLDRYVKDHPRPKKPEKYKYNPGDATSYQQEIKDRLRAEELARKEIATAELAQLHIASAVVEQKYVQAPTGGVE